MATAVPLPYWKVLKEPKNGAKIAGKRHRKLGTVFQAAEAMMRMQVLEGIVGECDANGVLKSAVAAGAAGGSSGGTGTSSGSAGTPGT